MQVGYPNRVTSSGGRYCFDDDQETPDTYTVCYEFEGERSITWAQLSCNRHSLGFITFYGEKGALDLGSKGAYTIYDKEGAVVKKLWTAPMVTTSMPRIFWRRSAATSLSV